MENPIKMDDLGIPLFLEKPISGFEHVRFFGGVRRACLKDHPQD